MPLGKSLLALRKEVGLTQKQLVEATILLKAEDPSRYRAVSETWLVNLERGVCDDPKLKTLRTIQEALRRHGHRHLRLDDMVGANE